MRKSASTDGKLLRDFWHEGEMIDYRFPSLDTFTRYLSEARAVLDERKYTRRKGRSFGKSIVRSEDVELPSDKDE